MTERLLDAVRAGGREPILLDRRFSRTSAEVGRFSIRKLLQAVSLLLRVFNVARRRPPVLVYFVTNRTFSFIIDVLCISVLQAFGVRRVNYVHTQGWQALRRRGRIWRRLVDRLQSGAAVHVLLAPEMSADYGAPLAERVIFIRNTPGPGPGPMRPDEGQDSPNREQKILFFSNLIAEKGVLDFVKLAASMRDDAERLQFVIAGSTVDQGHLEELRSTIQELGVEHKVEIIGTVTGAAKWDLLASSDVLVFPSKYPFEAQPLTILEAQSVGTPVVAYDIGAIRSVVESGVNGVLVQDLLVEGLVDGVQQVLRAGHELRMRTAEAADRAVLEDTYRAEWRTLLDDVSD